MSVYFEVDGVCVWNPATGIGMLYLAIADDLAAVAGGPTGLSSVVNDEVTIDLPVFSAFTESLLSGHSLLQELARGFAAISLAMLERAGASLAHDDHELAALAHKIDARMPRL